MSGAHDLVWKALGDPVRRALLDTLRTGPLTTGALCEPFPQTRYGVMKHLDVLEAAGLISVERRGRERWNYLNAVVLKAALDRWITPFQHVWSDRLTNLAQSLREDIAMSAEFDEMFLDIRQEMLLPASPERVFAALTREIGLWWTSPFRQAGAGSSLRLIPKIGEAMIETGPDGHEVVWGRVEEVRAPNLLYMSGRFAVKGAVAGRVHFDLASQGEQACRLIVAHQAMGRISSEARAQFCEGWRELLDRRLRAHLEAN